MMMLPPPLLLRLSSLKDVLDGRSTTNQQETDASEHCKRVVTKAEGKKTAKAT
jgi:hypothetical protein